MVPISAPPGGGRSERGRPGLGATPDTLVLLFPRLFARPFAGQRCFYALFLAGLQVKGVTLDLLDNVFLLHLALETAQRVFEGFSLLKSNFRQTDTPPDSSGRTRLVMTSF